MTESEYLLDPRLLKDLSEARADLTRHGIAILRSVEVELEPALMKVVKDALAASPRTLSKMDEDELDKFLERTRKEAMRSAESLRELYLKLLSRLGTDPLDELVDQLDGIRELFKWSRIQKTADPVGKILEKEGFGTIELIDPLDISEAFQVELEERWPAAFERFETLATEASQQIAKQAEAESSRGRRTAKVQKKG